MKVSGVSGGCGRASWSQHVWLNKRQLQWRRSNRDFLPKSFCETMDCLAFSASIVIFFSLTKAPLPDPTPTPPNTPKRTRNGPETDSKQTRNGPETDLNGPETVRNGPEMDQNQVLWGGTARGFVGRGGGVGVVREKENHYASNPNF